MDNETLIELTADIVSAHVGHNRIEVAAVPRLIQSVYDALASAGQPASSPAPVLQPKVSVRASVKPEAITCLDCGARMKMLKRHLAVDHGLTPEDYRARWGLPADYPMVAPDYAEKRRTLAKQIGLGRKPGAPKKRAGQAEAAADAE